MADSLRDQLAGNPRLRIGIALVLVIIGSYFTLDKAEQVNKSQQEYRRLNVRIAQTRQQASETAWPARSAAAGAALDALRQRDWTDSTDGLLQARWNDWLQALLTQEKAGNSTITLTDAPLAAGKDNAAAGTPDTMRPIKAKLHFEVPPKVLYNILQAIDTHQQTMVVDTLSYRWMQTVGRAEINLRTFARISSPAQNANAAAPGSAPTKGQQ